jgi:acyl carrier protein
LLTGGDRLRQGGRAGQAFSLINHYGPTENTVVATCGVVDETGLGSPSIGRPIMNTRVYVLDTDRQPAAIGVTGELAIAGRGLARGYLGCPDLTAEKFVPHPYGVTGERLYLTGDLVKCKNDGRIDFINRKDTQVKIRGYRLELGEIEAVLNGHPGVKQSLVVALDGTAGDKRLIAYFIPEEKSLRTSQELKQFSKEKLPEYMIPSAFVKLDRFPLTRHGKVDVKALPVPEAGLVSTGQDYTPPRTELERAIAAIWQDVLGVTDIGVRENFFDRGGNSLLIVRMAGALRDNLGMELSVVDVFNHPTISSLASLAAPVQDDHTFVGSILERAKMRQQAMDR